MTPKSQWLPSLSDSQVSLAPTSLSGSLVLLTPLDLLVPSLTCSTSLNGSTSPPGFSRKTQGPENLRAQKLEGSKTGGLENSRARKLEGSKTWGLEKLEGSKARGLENSRAWKLEGLITRGLNNLKARKLKGLKTWRLENSRTRKLEGSKTRGLENLRARKLEGSKTWELKNSRTRKLKGLKTQGLENLRTWLGHLSPYSTWLEFDVQKWYWTWTCSNTVNPRKRPWFVSHYFFCWCGS